MPSHPALVAIPVAALVAAGMIVLLMPLLRRYAMARPNARSSHAAPTPQGGGIAVIGAAVLVGVAFWPEPFGQEAAMLAAATLGLAFVGTIDDIRPLPVLPRLLLQALAVGGVVAASGTRLFPDLPVGAEWGLSLLAGLWFVNLVNFMDGLDWMTVAEVVPVAGALVGLGLAGHLAAAPLLVAACLLGAMLGFAPFNRPVARLFLGDVGSLPIGLLLAWLLYRLAGEGGFAAALLLPLYYLADATLTLLRRAQAREPVWQAHRSHFYQRATANGRAVPAVVGTVFALNLALALLAAATLVWPSWPVALGALALGAALVAGVLALFATPRGQEPAAA
ncbi:glycosyl transferase [Methylobacterium oryzihabitans]|uniref:Glycosyl transferase n=1 Tax=Methylobacterium oryzihabitans TaxID=2499852 RepID=A0A437PBY1_9HYPH|nr:glycosyl transferase [Methylobacterium oryzihabitans]RVU19768.1 glycosyl transferase [Methylobacterium oryzihabitans]